MSNFLNNLYNFKGKVAVVIGGGGHLCSEMALGLASCSVKVVVVDLRDKKVNAILKRIKKKGAPCMGLALDVSKKENLEYAKKEILKKFKKI